MISCPNKNLSEWKNLVEEHGEAYAMIAYIRNGSEIPSMEQAERLIAPDFELAETGSSSDPYMRSVISSRIHIEAPIQKNNYRQLSKEMDAIDMQEATLEVMTNFETYFPDYKYLDENQRNAMALNLANGKLKAECGL